MTKSRTDELFGGMSVRTIALFITAIIEMLMFSFWSRHLTKIDFGYMAAITGILAIVDCIAEAGLGAAIVQKKNASKEFVSTAFTLSLILGIVGTLFVFILAPQLAKLVSNDEYLTIPLRIMSITVLIRCLLSVSNNQLVKQLRFKRNATITISSYVLSCLVGIVMIYWGFGFYALIISNILCPLFNILLIYITSLKLPKIQIHKQYVKGIVSYGGWLTAGAVVNTFTSKADSLMLSRLLSVEALGAYNRPAGFVNTISMKINSIFDSVLFPLLSGIQDDKKKIKDVLLRSISLLNSCSIVLAAIFFFNAELIIVVFFGDQWLELVPIMRIVSVSIIFKIDGRLVDCFFRSLNLVKLGAYLRFLQGAIYVVGIIIGAHFGITGVAVAIVSCDILVILIKVLALTLSVKVPIADVLKRWVLAWRSILPILAISIPYMFISHSLLINIIYAFVFSLVFLSEFVFWPFLVGDDYNNTVGPQIDKVLKKIGVKRGIK